MLMFKASNQPPYSECTLQIRVADGFGRSWLLTDVVDKVREVCCAQVWWKRRCLTRYCRHPLTITKTAGGLVNLPPTLLRVCTPSKGGWWIWKKLAVGSCRCQREWLQGCAVLHFESFTLSTRCGRLVVKWYHENEYRKAVFLKLRFDVPIYQLWHGQR